MRRVMRQRSGQARCRERKLASARQRWVPPQARPRRLRHARTATTLQAEHLASIAATGVAQRPAARAASHATARARGRCRLRRASSFSRGGAEGPPARDMALDRHAKRTDTSHVLLSRPSVRPAFRLPRSRARARAAPRVELAARDSKSGACVKLCTQLAAAAERHTAQGASGHASTQTVRVTQEPPATAGWWMRAPRLVAASAQRELCRRRVRPRTHAAGLRARRRRLPLRPRWLRPPSP